jgi:hypothetical protein
MLMTKTSLVSVSDTRQPDWAMCVLCTQGLKPIVLALYVCCENYVKHTVALKVVTDLFAVFSYAYGVFFFNVVLRPNAGNGLLILEVF